MLTLAAVAAAVLGAKDAAAATDSPPAARLRAVVEDVRAADGARFDSKDDRGVGLDGLDVLQTGGTTVGVHHAALNGKFYLDVATSDDLLRWRHRATLDTDASQGTLAALPDGSFLVVYEKANWLSLLPRIGLPPELALVQGLVDRINLRVRRYRNLAALLAGRYDRQITLPLTRSRHAEGTPHVAAIRWNGSLRKSQIDVGFHWFADTDGDVFPNVDRQASGTLTGLRRWRTVDEERLSARFLEATEVHEGFTAPPRGNLGDRSAVRLDGRPLALHEAQYLPNKFATWRLFLRDPEAGTVRPLHVRTPGGSTAFANPSVARVTAPSGRPATLVTAFVPSEGAAAGEAGTLTWFREDE